jgi:WD40 repeat protein
LDWSALIGVVSLAHPVLPQAWEPLTEWLDNPDNRTLLRLRERLSRQARLWKRTQCNREYLFGEAGFAAVRAFAEGFPDELEPLEADYLRHNGAWLAFVRQRNRRVRAFGLLLILLLLTASTAAWIAQRKSRDARLALHRVQLKEANLQSLGGNTPQAVEKALAAGLDLPGDAVRVLSLAFSRNRLLAMTRLPDPGLAAVDRAAANAAGDRLATLLPGQGARQWQLSDGRFVPAQTPILSDGTLQLHRLVMALETDTVFGVSEQGVYRLPAFAGAAPAYACGARAGAALALDAARQRLALAVPGAPGHQDLCVLDLTEPGRVLLRQPLAEQELRGLSFAPDGQALLTASALGRTHLLALDGAPGEAGIRLSLPAEGPLGRPFNQAIFDAGGQRIAIAAVDERVRLYRRDGQPLGELRHSNFNGQALQIHNSAVRALAFDPDGHFLVAVDDEGQVVRWTLDASAPNARDAVVLGHHDGLSIVSVEVAAAQPAGALVLTASLDGTARLWSLATGKPLAMFGHDAALSWARFAASATRVLSHSRRDQSLRLWSITPVSRLAFELKHPAPGNHIWHLDLTPLPGGHPARLEMDGETQPLLLASAGYDGQVRVWHYARDGRMPRLLHRFAQQETPDDTEKIRPVRRVQFSPSGRWLAAARFDGTARVHDLLSGRSCRFAAASENSGRVFWAVFDPRERWLLTASDDPHAPVRLFDPRLCQPVAPEAPLWGSSAPTAAVAVVALADATLVALGDETGRVRIMREHPGDDWQVLCERDTGLGAIGDLALDGDGRLLAIASEDSRLGLLELEPEGCGSLTLASGHGGRLYSVDFAPDGRSIVSASLDKTARLWNRAGRPLAILSGHQDRIYSARFSPGAGRWLLTASRDGSLRLWRVPRMDRVPDVPQELDAFLPLQASLGGAAFGAFSPDGRYVAGAYWENAALLWRVWREDGLTDRQIARHWGTDRARLALLREAYRFRDDNQVSEFTESWWDN